MFRYYTSNALYDYIRRHKKLSDQFIFANDNLWQLVYGDSQYNPKLLVLVSGTTRKFLSQPLQEHEANNFEILLQLSKLNMVPVKVIRFCTDTESIKEVYISSDGITFDSVSVNELNELFRSFGLPIKNSPTHKYLNDKESSAYHRWQRQTLGSDIKVSDFDLWKLDGNRQPRILFEIKRSFLPLDVWQPWKDDYGNFALLSNTVRNSQIDFYIMYYQRIKKPWEEKIDKLKLFVVRSGSNEKCITSYPIHIDFYGVISLSDLLNL